MRMRSKEDAKRVPLFPGSESSAGLLSSDEWLDAVRAAPAGIAAGKNGTFTSR